MDEQRIQAYVNLIRQLLGCASGEEMAVLQHHAELVDAGLLAVIQQYAEHLDSQGNGNAARWLLGIARQLAEAMGIVDAEVEGTPEDLVKFSLAVLQLVADSGGAAQQVYPFLAQHQEKLNKQLLQVYTREAFPQQWATTQNNLAIAYRDRIRGERADNLEQAIALNGSGHCSADSGRFNISDR